MKEYPERSIGRRRDDVYAQWDKRIRDFTIVLLGVFGVIGELLAADSRPAFIFLMGSAIGVPFVLNADESSRDKQNSHE